MPRPYPQAPCQKIRAKRVAGGRRFLSDRSRGAKPPLFPAAGDGGLRATIGAMTSINPRTRIVAKTILPVVDMDDAMAFYERLGFEVRRYDAGYAWMVHVGSEVLHLAIALELQPRANEAAVYFHVQDADAWHAAWSDVGIDLTPIQDEPWGMREFSLTDPSGNRLRVGQNT
jgi:predicted enzyme related to lactoylglutathione lyase